jgi:hypothetical protein
MDVRVQMLAGGLENGLGEIDEDTVRFGVFVENGGGENALTAAKIEKRADALASGHGDELEHDLDLFDRERDRAADILQELRDEIRILPTRGIFGHRGDHEKIGKVGRMEKEKETGREPGPF